MNVIVVDDEISPLLTFSSHIFDNPEITANMFSTQIDAALDFARKNYCKAVFLDINMPKINGIDLAKEFIKINPDVKVVFITGYAQNVEEIKKELGDNFYAFCYKPYDRTDLNAILENLVQDSEITVTFKAFSHFDCYVGNTVVDFNRAKSKELLALLVDRRGATVTMEEAITCLWSEKTIDLSKKLYRDAVCRLRLTLQSYRVSHIIDVKRARLNLNVKYCRCDAWDYDDGKPVPYNGEYMRPYEWATKKENNLTTTE